jgi:hypothetical protein
MIDMIGVAIATAFLFALALVCSVVLAVVTWLLVRKQKTAPRKRLVIFALGIPIAAAAYFWLCAAILPGESLFGDISEPLPNGWVVEALGKMPDFADIKDPKSPMRDSHMTEYVGKLAVEGELVVGQYSHPYDAFTPNPIEPYFIFDTKHGTTTEFQTWSALQAALGHPIALTEIQYFQSPLAANRRKIVRSIEFSPPIVGLLILIAFISRYRSRNAPSSPAIYT